MPASRRLRVGIIVYRDDPRGGGTLRVAETLAHHLPPEEVDCHLILAYGEPGAIARRATVPVHLLGATSAKDWHAWKRTRAWLAQAKFDILHFVDPVQWLYLISLGLPFKRLDHFHGRPILKAHSVPDRFLSMVHRFQSDAAIAITHGAKRGVAQAGMMSAHRLHVVYNGVDVDFFRQLPAKQAARQQLGLPADAILFGQVARIAEGNACLEIVAVLKHLPSQWHAVLVGDGPLRSIIAERSKEQRLADRIHFTGALDDVRPAYAALDAVVLLSRYQPFCLMLAEAMASGVLVFGLRGEGEYAEPENPLITLENSVFIPRRNPHDLASVEPEQTYSLLARAMQRCWENQTQRQSLLTSARHWVERHFSASHQARACLHVYHQLIAL